MICYWDWSCGSKIPWYWIEVNSKKLKIAEISMGLRESKSITSSNIEKWVQHTLIMSYLDASDPKQSNGLIENFKIVEKHLYNLQKDIFILGCKNNSLLWIFILYLAIILGILLFIPSPTSLCSISLDSFGRFYLTNISYLHKLGTKIC